MLILTLILHQFLIRTPHAAHIHIDVDVHRAPPLPIPPSSLPSSIPRARSSPRMRRRLPSRLSTLQRFFLFETRVDVLRRCLYRFLTDTTRESEAEPRECAGKNLPAPSLARSLERRSIDRRSVAGRRGWVRSTGHLGAKKHPRVKVSGFRVLQ